MSNDVESIYSVDRTEDANRARVASVGNNFDVRMALRNAELSGHDKAGEILDSGDRNEMLQFMKDTHSNEMGNGGKYSSWNDVRGVSQYWENKYQDSLDDRMSSNGSGNDSEEDKAPFVPREKSDAHQAAEETYQSHYDDGNPWAPSSAVDSYNTAFNNAKEAGRDMKANDYLMQRADDKKNQVHNRFMPYLRDKNTLARHETQHATSNFIDKIVHLGVKPPELSDPYETYKKYRDDIMDISDD